MRFILISFSFDQLLVQAGQRPCLYRILCLCAARRFLSCVHRIQMSLFLPFRNVTPRWRGSGGGREERPTTIAVQRLSARELARAWRESQPTLNSRASL